MQKTLTTLLILTFVILGTGHIGVHTIHAEEVESAFISPEEVEIIEKEILENIIEEAEREEDIKIPSSFIAFWQRIGESLDMTFTFDDVKRASKAVHYADKKTKIAEKILENIKDPDRAEKAEKYLARAEKFVAKVEVKKEKLLSSADGDLVGQVLEGLARHQVRKQQVFDKLEGGELSEEQQTRIQDMRQNSLEKSKGILRAVQNENMPEEVKIRLKAKEQLLEQRHIELKDFNQQKKELLDAVREGDAGAMVELETLREERREFVDEANQNIQTVRERLRQRVDNPDVSVQNTDDVPPLKTLKRLEPQKVRIEKPANRDTNSMSQKSRPGQN